MTAPTASRRATRPRRQPSAGDTGHGETQGQFAAGPLRGTSALTVEVLSKVVLRNKARGLAEYRPERAGIEFWMSGDRERLTACRRLPTELDVAASLRDDLEAELAEDADDLEA